MEMYEIKVGVMPGGKVKKADFMGDTTVQTVLEEVSPLFESAQGNIVADVLNGASGYSIKLDTNEVTLDSVVTSSNVGIVISRNIKGAK